MNPNYRNTLQFFANLETEGRSDLATLIAITDGRCRLAAIYAQRWDAEAKADWMLHKDLTAKADWYCARSLRRAINQIAA